CARQKTSPRCDLDKKGQLALPSFIPVAKSAAELSTTLVGRLAAQLLFNAQQLVVLGDAVGTAQGAGLDLTGGSAYGQVGNGAVLGFTRTVGNYRGVTGGLGHLDGFQGLGQRANLVELDQDRVAGALVDAFPDNLGVSHEQCVTDQLYLLSDLVGHNVPARPVGLVHAIFDGNDRVALAQVGEVIGETGGVELLAF